jgi:VWFA-related protein
MPRSGWDDEKKLMLELPNCAGADRLADERIAVTGHATHRSNDFALTRGITMRTLMVLVTLVGMAMPASAAKHVTVEQLKQTLAAEQGQSDADMAHQLSDLELTERLNTSALSRLQAGMPGEKSRQALTVLADMSAFLGPPAAEIPAEPAPDTAAQRKILSLTVNYVTQTIHQLPNFFATRVTNSFEDTPAVQRAGAISSEGLISTTAYQPLHLVGSSSVTVLYRDGREVVDATAVKVRKQQPAAKTLTTSGVFGPILATVLVDAAQSNKLAWSHWEQGTNGPQAVFGYAVPKDKSHYTVSWDSVEGQNVIDDCNLPLHSFSTLVAYHGEIAVDPGSGTILRLVLVADMNPDDFTVKSGIVVEYGQVEIGGKSYFGPAKSVSSTLAHSLRRIGMDGCFGHEVAPTLKRSLNDVVFEQYHMFRADARVLAGNEVDKQQWQASGISTVANSEPRKPEETSAAVVPVAGVGAPSETAVPNAPAEPMPADVTAAVPENRQAEAEQEFLLNQLPVYKTNARDVVVDVVVTKGNGDPVLGLTRQDFEVKEDGKAQAIDFFEEHTAKAPLREALQPMPKMPSNTYTNAPPAPEGDSVNVLLLDTLNTPQQDQAYIHYEIKEFLKKMQPGTRVAIFALGSKLRYIQGFTTDTAILLAALNEKRNGASPVKLAGSRDRGDQADDAADLAGLKMMRVQGVDAIEAAQGDMAGFDFGKRATITFEALNDLANYLAGVPGRKNLIWFSSSFPVVVFPTAEQRRSLESFPKMRGYLNQARKTADMLTGSKVAVYPVGAEGVMTEHIVDADNSGPAAQGGANHMGSTPDGPKSNGTQSPFIASAEGRANSIAAMEQIAASTGGKAYFNTNDLNGVLTRAINDGANYYTLSYSPSYTKMDGTYRDIEVRLPKGRYTVAYRHGYNADGPSVIGAAPGSDPLEPAMKLGLPGATGLLYGVRVVPATPQPAAGAKRAGQNSKLKGAFTRYSVDFFIRGTDVGFEQNSPSEQAGKIELGLMAYDSDGNAVNWDGVTQAMNLQPDALGRLRKSGIPVHMEIDVPNEDVYLVTGVFDWHTGKTGTLEIPLHPGR